MSNGEFGHNGYNQGWRAPYQTGCSTCSGEETVERYTRGPQNLRSMRSDNVPPGMLPGRVERKRRRKKVRK